MEWSAIISFDWEKEDTVDPSTGIILIPGHHGENCPGSGDCPGYECCCNECDYFLICFPELDWHDEKNAHRFIRGE